MAKKRCKVCQRRTVAIIIFLNRSQLFTWILDNFLKQVYIALASSADPIQKKRSNTGSRFTLKEI
jgi:hypothetical protein